MNEVEIFCADNPDMSEVFKQFAKKYASLANLWRDCPRSDWMLLILAKQHYRNTAKLGEYIDWLYLQSNIQSDKEAEVVRREVFNKYEGYAHELENELKAGRISESEARYRYFHVIWDTAVSATVAALEGRVTKLECNNVLARVMNEQENEEWPIIEINEDEIYQDGMREQAEKLREFLGNPFIHRSGKDFYHGKGKFSRDY